jgi:hypothetical protein
LIDIISEASFQLLERLASQGDSFTPLMDEVARQIGRLYYQLQEQWPDLMAYKIAYLKDIDHPIAQTLLEKLSTQD